MADQIQIAGIVGNAIRLARRSDRLVEVRKAARVADEDYFSLERFRMHHQPKPSAALTATYSFVRFSNNELLTTDTLEMAMAKPASAGDKSHPG